MSCPLILRTPNLDGLTLAGFGPVRWWYLESMPFAWWELILILLVLLLVFGAKRLPEMGRSLGKGMREFKDSVSGLDDDRDTVRQPAELPAASSEPEEPAEPHGIPAEETERERVS